MKDNKAYNRRLVFRKDLKHSSDWEPPEDQSECPDTEEVTSTSLITGLTNSTANNNQSGTGPVSGENQQMTFSMFEFYQNGNLAIVNVTVEKQDIFKLNKAETVLQANIYHDLIGCPSTSPKPTPTPTTTTLMTLMTEEPEDYTIEEHTPEEYTPEEVTPPATIRTTKESPSFKWLWLWLLLIVIVILILTLCVYCIASLSRRRCRVAVTPTVILPPPQDEKVRGKDIKAEDVKGKEKSLVIEKGFGTEKGTDLTGVRRNHIQTDIGKSMSKFDIEKSTKSLFQPTPSIRSFH